MLLLGSLQFDLFPSALLFPPSLKPKAHHFSFPRILSQSAAGTKMEDGAWGLGKLARDLRLGCAPVPFLPCTVPGTDLGLSLLSLAPSDPRHECAAATLGSADLQRARVGTGGCCSVSLLRRNHLDILRRLVSGRRVGEKEGCRPQAAMR